MRGNGMTAAAASIAPSGAEYRKAITAGVIGNVLEWYDFGVYGYLVPTISALFFPGGDPLVSLLSTFAVFGVGFVMRPVGSILFGVYGDKHGRRKALSAVIFVMAIATFAMGVLPGRRHRTRAPHHRAAVPGALGRWRVRRLDRLY